MSLNRHSMLILMLAGSVGLPYLSSTQFGQQASQAMDSSPKAESGTHHADAAAPPGSTYSHSPTGPGAADPYTSPSSYSSNAYSGSTAYSSSAMSDGSQGKSQAPTPAQSVSTTASAIGGGYSSGTDRSSNSADSARQSTSATGSGGAGGTPAEGSGKTVEPPHALADVLRFEVTVPWIIEHWPRVTSGLSQLDLHGYRVPLITGTGESDLAGSLTYYFDKKQHLERIIFHGTSGDPRALVTYVTNHFELKRVIVPDPGLAFYQRTSWGKSHSELLIRPCVLRADVPNKRYEIEMAIKRP